MSSKENTIQDKPFHKRYANKIYHNKKNKYKYNNTCVAPSNFILCSPSSNPFFKQKWSLFCLWEVRTFAPQCRYRVVRNDNPPKPRANLVEGDDIIIAVISKVNVVTNVNKCVVDSGAIKHICANKSMFTSYTVVGDGEEQVYLGDLRTTQVQGKGKDILKLTFGKTLALNDVLHAPSSRVNLVFEALLGKVGVKISFESDKIVMTKNNIFVGKGYYDQGLFVLNVSDVINENASSFSYLIDSYDI